MRYVSSTNPSGTGGWSVEQSVPGAVSEGDPAAVVYNGVIYVFYQEGPSNTYELYYTTYNGNSWATPQQVPATQIGSYPAPIVFNNKIYVFHSGDANNGQLWYNVFDGSSWAGDAQITSIGAPVEADSGPSPVTVNGNIVIFYTSSTSAIWWVAIDGSGNPHGSDAVPISSVDNTPYAVIY